MFSYAVIFLAIGICHAAGKDDICSDQPADPTFTFDRFEGVWYEIGKLQTPGGAAWQEGCVCTAMNITILNRQTGDAQAEYSCRFQSPDGDLTQIPARLIDMTEPGKWRQEFFPGVPTVSWTVIILGDDFGVQYDCGQTFTSTEYCVHIISRRPQLDGDILNELIEISERLGLNPLRMEYQPIDHEGCWTS